MVHIRLHEYVIKTDWYYSRVEKSYPVFWYSLCGKRETWLDAHDNDMFACLGQKSRKHERTCFTGEITVNIHIPVSLTNIYRTHITHPASFEKSHIEIFLDPDERKIRGRHPVQSTSIMRVPFVLNIYIYIYIYIVIHKRKHECLPRKTFWPEFLGMGRVVRVHRKKS